MRYRGRNVTEVLDLTVREALAFFSTVPKVLRRLQVLDEIGLGYLRLGQPATTLSGGEAQRIKIAAHLASHAGERLLYILDEPTTGLHFDDIAKLLAAFRKLLEAGHTLVVIEHNLDVIKTADWIIDLGPEGGEEGGAGAGDGHARTGGGGDGLAHRPLPAADPRLQQAAADGGLMRIAPGVSRSCLLAGGTLLAQAPNGRAILLGAGVEVPARRPRSRVRRLAHGPRADSARRHLRTDRRHGPGG